MFGKVLVVGMFSMLACGSMALAAGSGAGAGTGTGSGASNSANNPQNNGDDVRLFCEFRGEGFKTATDCVAKIRFEDKKPGSSAEASDRDDFIIISCGDQTLAKDRVKVRERDGDTIFTPKRDLDGDLDDGVAVVVKDLDLGNHDDDTFRAELLIRGNEAGKTGTGPIRLAGRCRARVNHDDGL